MDRHLFLVVVLFAVFEIHCQAPTAAAGGLELGVTYSFHYNTTVLLSELRPRAAGRDVRDVGYQILAEAQCAVIWQHPADHRQQLLRITVSSPQLLVRSRRAPQPDGFVAHSSRLDDIPPVEVLLLTAEGAAKQLYAPEGRAEEEVGLARGLLGLITVREEGKYRETDASGECDVTYVSEGAQRVLKTKERCSEAAPIYTAGHPVLDVSVTSERVTRYSLSAGQLETVTSEERHGVTPAVSARDGYGTTVTALQTLQLSGRTRSAPAVSAVSAQEALRRLTDSAALGWTPRETRLWSRAAPADGARHCDRDAACPELSDLVSRLRTGLTEPVLSTLPAATGAVTLVPALRAATETQVLEVLRDKRNADIRLSLLDLCGAAHTLPVHSAVKKALGWPPRSGDDIALYERYLVALSTGGHPDSPLVRALLSESRQKLPSPELHETVLLTAAALASSLCTQTGGTAEQLCTEFAVELLTQVESCGVGDDSADCCLPSLRALGNLRTESSAAPLLKLALSGDTLAECRAEALRALSALPVEVTGPLRPDLEALFGQPERYDVTSRLLSADLLLRSPRPSDAGLLLSRLEDRSAAEESSYLLQRLRAAAARHEPLRRALGQLLSDSRLANYDILAQGALSAALERELWSAGGAAAGFTSLLEAGRSRALRRSEFTARLEADGRRLDMLQFSVQAAGLSSLIGSPDPDDAADARARLQLGLLGRQLRPRRLFGSQTELMGLLWSGAGSETTSALRGTVLLQDHDQAVPLQNGLTAHLTVLAATSFDLAGRVEVSLWNRAAQAEMNNRAAVVLRALSTVHTPFVRARIESTQALEASMAADTDMQFSDGPKTCARIGHRPLVLREVVRKQERVPGSRHRLRRVRRRSRSSGGATFNLNQRNADTCRAMFG
ncbi:microsomal triglyceride transfer protein large subunit-like isoform X1 [Amphibalanus amphitrite]|uniref:microsomal triglyceride transfer protein large subunit-like isoform X1 n=1 Tax=Amphibalanus amphitrite TaxID=1232801 RepID=UPI001C9107CB|nr:microsomal triglyceride transfer protein large subunit-like isoform X1 [Amphibalanus amphitrite]